MRISYSPIGYFRSPYRDVKGMPVQPVGAEEIEGCIEVLPEFLGGLKDLEGFSHVHVLCHLHRISGYDLMVKPFLDTERHGVFATRSPKRPNPISLSVMRLQGICGDRVMLRGIDILDGTPVLDLKPYVAEFDQCDADRFGWFAGKSHQARYLRSDERFVADLERAEK
jgi:tRNA (adenine37-N6)-methyltransferase